MNNIIEDEYLMYNTSSRIPICVCVDTSAALNESETVGNMLKQIENGINNLYNKVIENDMVRDCVEVGVISFGEHVKVIQDYTCTSKYDQQISIPVNTSMTGAGDIGTCILQSLDLLQNRKQLYNAHGVDYHRPWLVIITDGKPVNKEAKKSVALAKKNVLKLEKKDKLTIITIYINSNESTDVTNESLQVIIKKSKDKSVLFSKKVTPQIIGTNKITQLFDWLATTVSTQAFENNIKLDFSGLTDWEDI